MEQIYYTQCPVGYGLGASNGFQVKRLSANYPMSGDFRHLALKAFPGGGRVLAPMTLRYRRDGSTAEIAWLTPRPNEYETERGFWGRPGGHFAHGLRLDPGELKALKSWPAGLFDSPAWTRTDREPTRGRPLEPFELSPSHLLRPPTFADVAPLAALEDPDRLARLLTALARVVREGRTLFLIAEPARLGPLMALLTFAFPEKLREDLTFSTYHDRPEELPGFRISGTIPAARPNKPALTAQGIVADLVLGTFEPAIIPAPWATTLAGWLIRHDAVDEADWSITDARVRAFRRVSNSDPTVWDDAWLDHLFVYPQALRDREPPADPDGWSRLADFTRWLRRTGLAPEWVRIRNAGWWLDASTHAELPWSCDALVEQARLDANWKDEAQAADWGRAVAAWFARKDAIEAVRSIASIVEKVPPSSRPSFAAALLRGLPTDTTFLVLSRLRNDPENDAAMLLPLEAQWALRPILLGGPALRLGPIVESALASQGCLSAVLDTLEAGLADRPEAVGAVAEAAALAFDLEAPGGGREGLAWALRPGRAAVEWLTPALRPVLADVGRSDLWTALRDRTPEDRQPALVAVVLAIAADPGLPDEAFRWGVEALLLPLHPRPHQRTWAETYLRRIPSDFELLKRLASPEYHKLEIHRWLTRSRGRDEISPEQAGRIDTCLKYREVLQSRDPRALLDVSLPDVPAEERGQLLGQMIKYLGQSGLEGLPFVLKAVRQAWPDAFRAMAPGLKSLAWPLARGLAPLNLEPDDWFGRLIEILDQLGLSKGEGSAWEPDGLAAEIVAYANKPTEKSASPWPLRRFLLKHDTAWRTLTADIRLELSRVEPRAAAEILDRWDQELPQDRPERFYELFLNACDGVRLAVAVGSRASALRTLPTALPWWNHAQHDPPVDDLREGYARLAPLAPLKKDELRAVRSWIEDRQRPPLSPPANDRWQCLASLTLLQDHKGDPDARKRMFDDWEGSLPLSTLSEDDKHRFLAWLIYGFEDADEYRINPLASWLGKMGFRDSERISRWADELVGLVEVTFDPTHVRTRLAGDLKVEFKRVLNDLKEKKRKDAKKADGEGLAKIWSDL